MQNLQYAIDTICARFTAEYLYQLVEDRMKSGNLGISDIVTVIQAKDRSLDEASALTLIQTAIEDMRDDGRLKTDSANS